MTLAERIAKAEALARMEAIRAHHAEVCRADDTPASLAIRVRALPSAVTGAVCPDEEPTP